MLDFDLMDRFGNIYTPVKTDSGLFYIIVTPVGKINTISFIFPIDNEYLEMMGELDLFRLYAKRVRDVIWLLCI